MTSLRPIGRQQLFLALQERIEQGHYAPGAWLPTERVLSEEFGMDRSAVRRALLQLEAQHLIVREPGKRPWVRGGPAARPLGLSRGFLRPGFPENAGEEAREKEAGEPSAPSALRTIVAILPQHPIYPASLAILHGVNAALRSAEAPFRLQVIDTHGGSESRETCMEKQALDSVIQENIAGVVLWHMGGTETLPQLRALERRGTPVVFVDRFPPDFPCDFVGGDNQTGVEEAVAYLRQLGHRRIAHLTTDERTTAVLERLRAYTEVMQAAEARPSRDRVFQVPHSGVSGMASACDHFFALPEPPTAVLAMNDSLAHQFIVECERRGLSVPEDVSVIGFDDLEQHSPRPALLTTLHQPFGRMGRRAAALLLRRLSGPEAPPASRQHILLPTPLIKRVTCQPPVS